MFVLLLFILILLYNFLLIGISNTPTKTNIAICINILSVNNELTIANKLLITNQILTKLVVDISIIPSITANKSHI